MAVVLTQFVLNNVFQITVPARKTQLLIRSGYLLPDC